MKIFIKYLQYVKHTPSCNGGECNCPDWVCLKWYEPTEITNERGTYTENDYYSIDKAVSDFTDTDKTTLTEYINQTMLSASVANETWHEPLKPIQVKLTFDDEINMLIAHPEMGVYRQETGIITYTDCNCTYNYADSLTPEVISNLNEFNAIITYK